MVIQDKPNNGAFSTDREAILEWAAYNQEKGARPEIYDSAGNLRVHGNTGGITGLGRSEPCRWIHVTVGDPNYYDNQCGSKLKEFENAYPPGQATKGDATSYMAVEQFKQTIRSVFNECGSYGCPGQSTGLRVFTDGWPGRAPDANGGATTAGRYWRDQANPVPKGASSKVSRPGNIFELAEQVDPVNSAKVIEQIRSRVHQIKQGEDNTEIDNLLRSKTLELGEVAYIHRNGSGDLVYDNSRPLSMVGDVTNIRDKKRQPAGGVTQVLGSGWYQTIGTLVNPEREGNIHLQLYTSFPSVNIGRAEDRMKWQPGVGGGSNIGAFNLGRVTFENKCGGEPGAGGGAVLSSSGSFCQPD